MKEHKNIYILLIALCIGVVGLSIGYAALSTQLTITTNKITISAQTWKVAFNNGTVNAITSSTSNTGFSCGVATVDDSSVSIAESLLSKPGDKCTYALTIKNTGSIDARLSNIVSKNPAGVSCTGTGSSFTCGNITYKVTTDKEGQNLLATNGIIKATTGTLPVYLFAEYTGNSVSADAANQAGAGFTFTYSQN